MENDKLLRAREVAERLGVTSQMVYLLIKDGKLKSIKVGEKSIRIAESEFNDYLHKLNKRD